MTRTITTTRKARRRLLAGLAVLVLVLGAWQVRDIGPASLPSGQFLASGWKLKVQFPDVLNLPAQAKVRVQGRSVGSLESVRLADKYAEATLLLETSTKLPRSTTAELRQDTPMGDVYVALTPPEKNDGGFFTDGDTVPASQTRAPVQMETMLTSLAEFLGSGSLSQLGNTFARVNSSFPDDPKTTKKIVSSASTTLRSIADNSASLDGALVSLVDMTNMLREQRDRLAEYLGPDAPRRWKTILETGRVMEVFAALAPVFANGAFLVPTLQASNSLVRSVIRPLMYFDRPLGSTRTDNLTNFRDLLRDTVIPYLQEGPKVNVVRLGIGTQMSSGEQADLLLQTLRMLGAVR